MARRRPEKLPATAAADPEGPRLIPLKRTMERFEPVSSLTGYGWVSLADTALKVWDNADKVVPSTHRK